MGNHDKGAERRATRENNTLEPTKIKTRDGFVTRGDNNE